MAAQATERNELVVQQAAITILLGALGNTIVKAGLAASVTCTSTGIGPSKSSSVYLDGAFLLAEPGPRENRQTQIDRSRIDRINGALDVDAEDLIGIELARASDEQQSHVFID